MKAEQREAMKVRRAVFLPTTLVVFTAGCFGIYALSYGLWHYYGGEAQHQQAEVLVRCFAAVTVVTHSGICWFLLRLLWGPVRPRPKLWPAALLCAVALAACHLLAAYNGMPATSTAAWRQEVQSNTAGGAWSSELEEFREKRQVSIAWLLLPVLVAGAGLIATTRIPEKGESS